MNTTNGAGPTAETTLRFAPAVAGMTAFLEPFRPWIESVLGIPLIHTITFEIDLPFGEVVVEDSLPGVLLDRACVERGDGLRPLIERWELPDGVSPRIQLEPSRDRRRLVTARELAWDPHWKDTAIAVWLRGLGHPVVAVTIPYVSYQQGLVSAMRSWLLVRRDEAAAALDLLRAALDKGHKTINMIGGGSHPLPRDGYDWDSVVLDPDLRRLLRGDFEAFLQRETWFRRHRLPYRRGYLLYGPPGNGKTSCIRIMACHPSIRAHSLNFSNETLENSALTNLFEAAGRTAPSLIIFEDLDRLYGSAGNRDNLTKITLQHLLNCLDGLASQDGVIVVASANDPTGMDPAILRRPGRFDRVLACRPPTAELRRQYLCQLGAPVDDGSLPTLAAAMEDFSYAQVRETFILAGQLAFGGGRDDIASEDLLHATELVRGEGRAVASRADGRGVGFAACSPKN
jgi:hypothetical protein